MEHAMDQGRLGRENGARPEGAEERETLGLQKTVDSRRIAPALGLVGQPPTPLGLQKTVDSGRRVPAPARELGLQKTDSGRRVPAPAPAPVNGLARTVVSGRIAPAPGAPVDVRGDTLDSARLGARPAAAGVDRDMIFAAVEQRLLGRPAEAVRLDRFVLLDRLGSGGMGVVYAAYDPKLDRKIALKLLHASEQPGTAHFRHSQAQLEREARAAAKLSHPNVVQVYDVGVVDEQVYLALEYIDGSTLTDWLEDPERPRGWREIVEMFLETANGLIAAHDASVVHRDFKPDNVLLGADGRPRVADFGLARTTHNEGGEPGALAMISGPQYGPAETAEGMGAAHTVSAAGTIAGTPAYMSPEQFAGVTVGPASDQFSFCVALYEALFSARPFVGETLVALSSAVIEGALQEPPRGHGVPSGVVRAVMRGLESSEDDRFPTMRALADALRREVAPRRRWRWGVAGVMVCWHPGQR